MVGWSWPAWSSAARCATGSSPNGSWAAGAGPGSAAGDWPAPAPGMAGCATLGPASCESSRLTGKVSPAARHWMRCRRTGVAAVERPRAARPARCRSPAPDWSAHRRRSTAGLGRAGTEFRRAETTRPRTDDREAGCRRQHRPFGGGVDGGGRQRDLGRAVAAAESMMRMIVAKSTAAPGRSCRPGPAPRTAACRGRSTATPDGAGGTDDVAGQRRSSMPRRSGRPAAGRAPGGARRGPGGAPGRTGGRCPGARRQGRHHLGGRGKDRRSPPQPAAGRQHGPRTRCPVRRRRESSMPPAARRR